MDTAIYFDEEERNNRTSEVEEGQKEDAATQKDRKSANPEQTNEKVNDDHYDGRVPQALFWSVDQVCEWIINDIGLPQYEACFRDNLIDGHKLVLLDASHLPKIGITYFEDIQRITTGIRTILNLEDVDYFRSITLWPRSTNGMYFEVKSVNGDNTNQLSYKKFLKMTSCRIWQPPLSNMHHVMQPKKMHPKGY